MIPNVGLAQSDSAASDISGAKQIGGNTYYGATPATWIVVAVAGIFALLIFLKFRK